MPSIPLHVLRVDQYQYQNNKNDRKGANGANGANTGNKGGNRNRMSKDVAVNHFLSKNNGGMKWGTIAIYNCSVTCEGSRTSSDSMHDDRNDAGDIIISGSVKSEFVIF